jgi:peptide/nickel transport system permease protein
MEPPALVAARADRAGRAGAAVGGAARVPARRTLDRARHRGARGLRGKKGMLNYIVRRAIYGLLILIGVNVFTFCLFFTVNTPDDMARLNIGGKRVTADQIQKWKAERGYDKPLYWNESKQGSDQLTETIFWDRSVSLFSLKFGRADGENAGDIGTQISERMWASFQLALPLFVLQVIASTLFALLLVFFRRSRLDFWGVVLCVVMLSISSLFYIIVGQFLFSRVFRLVPISGYAQGLDAARFLILPILLSLLARLGSEARLYRAMFLEEMGKDYVRTAKAKGLAEHVVLLRHVLRNALIPIMTSAGAYLPYVFLGSLVFESFFGIPGLGAYVIEAISGQDFAIVRSMVFLGSLLYIASYVAIDVLYTWADPRVRLS